MHTLLCLLFALAALLGFIVGRVTAYRATPPASEPQGPEVHALGPFRTPPRPAVTPPPVEPEAAPIPLWSFSEHRVEGLWCATHRQGLRIWTDYGTTWYDETGHKFQNHTLLESVTEAWAAGRMRDRIAKANRDQTRAGA